MKEIQYFVGWGGGGILPATLQCFQRTILTFMYVAVMENSIGPKRVKRVVLLVSIERF